MGGDDVPSGSKKIAPSAWVLAYPFLQTCQHTGKRAFEVNGGRTSSRGTDQDHAQLLGSLRAAGAATFKTLDARLEAGNDVLQVLELILDDTHCDGVVGVSIDHRANVQGRGKEKGRRAERDHWQMAWKVGAGEDGPEEEARQSRKAKQSKTRQGVEMLVRCRPLARL